LEEGADLPFLPLDPDELALLVDLFWLETTLAELRRVLLDNPLRADVALHGLTRLLRRIGSGSARPLGCQNWVHPLERAWVRSPSCSRDPLFRAPAPPRGRLSGGRRHP